METVTIPQSQPKTDCICSKFREASTKSRRLCNNILSNCLAFQVAFASNSVSAGKKREIMIKYVDAMLDGINEATEFIDCNADYLPSTLSEAVKVCTENLLSAIDDGIIRSNDPWELFAIGARGLNAIDEIIERIFGSGIIKE